MRYQHHRDDRVRRVCSACSRCSSRSRGSTARPSSACAVSKRNKKPVATQTIVVAAKPLRFGNELTRDVAARSSVAGRGAAGRRLRQDRRCARRAASASCSTAIEPNEPMLPSKITGPGQRATLSAMLARRHEGRDHPRQRRRRRRRLRAAGRSRRRRADAPGRQEHRRPPMSCCRTRACWRSIRSPTSAPTSRRWSRPSRSRSTSRRAEALARGLGRQLVADAAQGRRGDGAEHAPHHAQRSRRRRSRHRTTDSPRSRSSRGATEDYEYSVARRRKRLATTAADGRREVQQSRGDERRADGEVRTGEQESGRVTNGVVPSPGGRSIQTGQSGGAGGRQRAG